LEANGKASGKIPINLFLGGRIFVFSTSLSSIGVGRVE